MPLTDCSFYGAELCSEYGPYYASCDLSKLGLPVPCGLPRTLATLLLDNAGNVTVTAFGFGRLPNVTTLYVDDDEFLSKFYGFALRNVTNTNITLLQQAFYGLPLLQTLYVTHAPTSHACMLKSISG